MRQTPSPQQVGLLYDSSPEVRHCGAVGGNIHCGYWPDAESEHDTMDDAQHRLTDLLISRLDARSGMRVLDLGCGVGVPTLRLARATGAEIVGITVSGEQVRRATARAEAEGLAERVSFRHADATHMPFPDESFDAVFALESIVHVPDRGRLLREVRRVLRSGGRIVLTDLLLRAPVPPDRQPMVDAWLTAWLMVEPLGPDDYARVLREAGLLVAEFEDIGDETIRKSFRLAPAAGADASADPFRTPGLADVPALSYLLAVGVRPA